MSNLVDEEMPLAGPSRPVKPARKHRRAKKTEVDPSSVAGPSSQPAQIEAARLARKEEKKLRKHAGALRTKEDQWECVPIARTAVSKVPPIWSNDGRFYFTVSGHSVNIHSSLPPAFERLSTIGTGSNGHTKSITAMVLHPTNPMQIVTSAEDGTVKVWDWVEGRLVRTLTFAENGKVWQIALGVVGGKWQVFANVGVPKQNHDPSKQGYYLHFRVQRIPLSPPTPAAHSQPYPVGKLSYNPTALIISPKFTYLVALSANKAYTYRLPSSPNTQNWKPSCVKFVSDQNFTCGAFAPDQTLAGRPDEEWFATGDVKGVIRLWHGLTSAFRTVDSAAAAQTGTMADPSKALYPDTEKRLPTTSLHWHAHAVNAIAFTPSGAQLLSVGEESVLVQWHLATGKKEYIPRLGGRPIISLAVKSGGRGVEEEWWVKMIDGGVARIGSASGNVITVGQGVRLDPLRPKQDAKHLYPLAVHPPTRSLVLPSSHASTLQFIDPHSSSVLFDLEVAPSNRVSRRDEKDLEAVAVEHVAFTDNVDGGNRWMATVEGRQGDESEGGGLIKTLKLWRWQGDKYVISTQFPRPHGQADITMIAFSSVAASDGQSSHPYLVTASTDGTAKLWQVKQAKRPEQGKGTKKLVAVELYWANRSTFSYRSSPVYDAVFSSDSTILALAHGSVVTLWDVERNVLLKALTSLPDVRQIGFVGTEGRYLVGAQAFRGIAVWDLLSCEVVWSSVNAQCHRLIASPQYPFFIAVHEPNHTESATVLTVYRPTSSNPLRTTKTNAKINHLILLPPTPGSAVSPKSLQFTGISYYGEISRFGDRISQDVVVGTNSIKSPGDKSVSIWQEMFGKDAFLEVEGYETVADDQQAQEAISKKKLGNPAEVYEGASHTLPPVSLLFDSFLEQILPAKTTKVNGDSEDKIIYEDEDQIMAEDVTRQTSTREVKQEDIDDLEVFFRETLKTGESTSSKPKKHLANGIANGKALPNGKADDSPSQPKTTTKSPKKALAAVESDEDDEEREVGQLGTSGKKRGRKRRAPKEA